MYIGLVLPDRPGSDGEYVDVCTAKSLTKPSILFRQKCLTISPHLQFNLYRANFWGQGAFWFGSSEDDPSVEATSMEY